jgi:hypothetical protein
MELQQLITNSGYVTADGAYGSGAVIVFDEALLTDEQWETLGDLRDNDKYDYVLAVLNNEDLSEWED